MRNITDGNWRKLETHNLCSITLFLRKSCCLKDNLEKQSMAGQATDNNITRRMRIAYWISNATDINSEYILIAYRLQRWLRGSVWMLRYTYIHVCLVLLDLAFVPKALFTTKLDDTGKCKGKVHPRIGREGSEGELYSSFNLCARWGGWSTPRPGRLTLGKETRYPLYRRLGGPQGRSGYVRKISPPQPLSAISWLVCAKNRVSIMVRRLGMGQQSRI
jgi:hypothetical protein